MNPLSGEFQFFHYKPASKKKRVAAKWQSPPRGRLKMNTDGAFDSKTGRGGIGVVVRDESGRSIAVIAK